MKRILVGVVAIGCVSVSATCASRRGPDGSFAFVLDGRLVLDDSGGEGSEGWGADLDSVERRSEEPAILVAPSTAVDPIDAGAWAGSRVLVFGSAGLVCEAHAREAEWYGRGTDRDGHEGSWSDAAFFFGYVSLHPMIRLEPEAGASCDGARWATLDRRRAVVSRFARAEWEPEALDAFTAVRDAADAEEDPQVKEALRFSPADLRALSVEVVRDGERVRVVFISERVEVGTHWESVRDLGAVFEIGRDGVVLRGGPWPLFAESVTVTDLDGDGIDELLAFSPDPEDSSEPDGARLFWNGTSWAIADSFASVQPFHGEP